LNFNFFFLFISFLFSSSFLLFFAVLIESS